MPRLFISYSRKDADFAHRLAADLERLGADIWIDVDDIPVGMKWSSAIQHGLDDTELMLVIISPEAMASVNVEDEWQYFLDQQRPVIPLLWRPAKVHFQLKRIQYIDFHHQEYVSALRQLHTELGRKGVVLQPILPGDDVSRSPIVSKMATTSSDAAPEVAAPTDDRKRDAETLQATPDVIASVVSQPSKDALDYTSSSANRASTPTPAKLKPQGKPRFSRIPMRIGMVAAVLLILAVGVVVNVLRQPPYLVGTFSGHTAAVYTVAFSPDGKQILTGSFDMTARLWDVATGKTVQTFSGHTNAVTRVAFSPDGKQVLTGSADMTARLWDIATGKTVQTFTSNTNDFGVAFSPDGKQILIGSADDTARLWDMTTGKTVQTFSGHTDSVTGVALSPDGKQVLTGSSDNTARLWDVATGKAVQTFSGHTAAVYTVAFSPDGNHVLTGSSDGTARLWDVATGRTVQIFSGHTNSVESLAFSPDGKQILTGSLDNTARLWDVKSQ